jgi:hypothetical protein
MVGHFTAVVWKDMHAIGCAVGACGSVSQQARIWAIVSLDRLLMRQDGGTYIACCYDPFPNMLGE